MFVIHFKYTKEKSWNVSNPYTKEEFFSWLEHEKKYGNKIIYDGGNVATIIIDY